MNEEEKEAIEILKDKQLKYHLTYEDELRLFNIIEKQQKDIHDLEWKENEQKELLKYKTDVIEKQQKELEKKDKIIDKLLMEITAVNSGRYEYMDNDRVLEIFTNLVEKENI